MRLFASLMLLSFSVFAAEKGVGSRADLEQLLKSLPAHYQKAPWYGNVATDKADAPCGLGIRGADGQFKPEGLSLFVGDINNDGKDEYVLVSRCGGSLATDTILEVFSRDGTNYTALGFDKVLAANHLDGSKIPMHIAQPFLIQSGGKTLMSFKPAQKWVWEKEKFQLVK